MLLTIANIICPLFCEQILVRRKCSTNSVENKTSGLYMLTSRKVHKGIHWYLHLSKRECAAANTVLRIFSASGLLLYWDNMF